MGRNGKDKDKDPKDKKRLTGYVSSQEKQEWEKMMGRAAEKEGISNPQSGTFFRRIIKHKLRLDLASILAYAKTHTTQKRLRGQNTART